MSEDLKKVLFLTIDFPPMGGGMARHAVDVAAALGGMGRECVTIAPSPGDSKAALRRLASVRAGHIFDNYILSVTAYFVAGIRYFLTGKVSCIVANTWSVAGVAAFLIKKVTRAPYVVFANGLDVYAPQAHPKVSRLMGAVLNNADAVIAISNFTKGLVEKVAKSARVVVVNPIVDPDRLRSFAGSGRGDGRVKGRTILTVARLVESKGHDIVLRAMPEVLKKFPDTCYRIIGSGPQETALKKLAVDLGISKHVIFAGEVDETALMAYYRDCDIFVMTSREIPERGEVEGFGIVFLEAGIFSKPVVASRSGGISDAVLDGVTGIMAEPAGPESVANAVIRLFSDDALAKRMGEAGRSRAEKEFNPAEFARKLKDVIEPPANILYVSPFPNIGGGEVSILTIINNLDRQNFRPFLVCYEDGPFVERARGCGIETAVFRRAGFFSELFIIWKLTRHIKRSGIRLVHVNSLDIRAGIAAMLAGVPCVGHLRVIFPLTWRDRAFVRLSRVTIAVSNAVVDEFCKGRDGYKDKFIVMPNMVELAPKVIPEPLREEFAMPADAPLVGMAGRMDPFKGHSVFIDAAAIIRKSAPKTKFFIIGAPGHGNYKEESYLEAQKKRVREAGLADSVIFTGFRKDILITLAALDVIVIPSRVIDKGHGEGFGRVAIEAMAVGVPIVSSDTGGLKEIVEDGVSGLLVPEGDPAAIADAVLSLLTNKDKAKALAAAGRARFDALYSVKLIAKLQSLYYDIIKKEP